MFSSNGTLLLLHNNLSGVKKSSKYDLVLSPQFYIVKREKLPVKYAFQAKKLAPSVMEDLLPSEFGYEYVVRKDGDDWLLFAYKPKEIENFLQGCCQIPPHKIGQIYFADQLKPVLKKMPIGIDEYNALTLVDDTATIVPRRMLESDRYAKFTSKLRPQRGFSFKPSSKAGKSDSKISKLAVASSVLMALLALAFLIEGVGYKKAITQELASMDGLFSNYPQLQSKLTRDSIKSKYSKIEKSQRAIREALDAFGQLSSKKSILSKLELKPNAIEATFDVDKKELKKLKAIVANADLKVVKESSNSITVQGALR